MAQGNGSEPAGGLNGGRSPRTPAQTRDQWVADFLALFDAKHCVDFMGHSIRAGDDRQAFAERLADVVMEAATARIGT